MVGDPPKLPRQYDFRRMSADNFEEMCKLLARLHDSRAEGTSNPDGGLDALVPGERADAAEVGWQAKHYPEQIAWPKCKESLQRAIETYGVPHVIFCFPRDLTVGQRKNFRKHLQDPHPDRKVEDWGAAHLTDLLNGSAQGQRIANRYFFDPEGNEKSLARTIAAGGPMESIDQIFDRLETIGDRLQEKDPRFSYQTHQRETGDPPAPAAPGTAMRVERIGEEHVTAIDVRPRVPEAKLGGHLQFADDEAGREALKRFQRATREGGELVLDEGVELVFSELPQAFEDFLGTELKGTLRIAEVRRSIPPWPARIEVATDAGKSGIDLDLELSDEAPSDADAVFVDELGGLKVTIVLVREGDTGSAQINWHWTGNAEPVQDQLVALRLLQALGGTGTVRVVDRSDTRPVMEVAIAEPPADRFVAAALGLFEDLRTLEEFTGTDIAIPEEVSPGLARAVAEAAHMAREGTVSATWRELSFDVPKERAEQASEGGQFRLEEQLFLKVGDQELLLGTRIADIPAYEVARTEPAPDDPENRVVLWIRPPNEEAARIEMQLRAPSVASR